MTGHVAQIWRHPIKAHGREPLDNVHLTAGHTIPWDRKWAVRHENSRAAGPGWAPCVNFSIGSKAPGLQAISARTDTRSGRMTLSHPDRPDLCFDPATEADRFLAWAAPLMPPDRPASTGLVAAPDRGMTDTAYPSVSLINLASSDAVGDHLGQDISPLRWRGNILFEDCPPWEEFDWIGKRLAVGSAQLRIVERIKRCRATQANPATGTRDIDTLAGLQSGWGHTDFGVYAEVTGSGDVAVGDKLVVRA